MNWGHPKTETGPKGGWGVGVTHSTEPIRHDHIRTSHDHTLHHNTTYIPHHTLT
jgi:hypothetical protein